MVDPVSGDSRYLALTTYRRDGRPVTTPVWAAPLAGHLYVVTAKSTGKARRVSATSRVRFAPCNVNGRRILGEWQEGTAAIVLDQTRRDEALALLQRKYGWQMLLARLVFRLRGVYHDRAVLELTLERDALMTLASLMQGPLPLTAPLVLNPLMAKLVEAAAFAAGYLGGGATGYQKVALEANLNSRRTCWPRSGSRSCWPSSARRWRSRARAARPSGGPG